MDAIPNPNDAPDLTICGLAIWGEGRPWPDADNAWDRSWIDVRIAVTAPCARVEFRGPFLRRHDIAAFLGELETLSQNLRGQAALKPLEPYIRVCLAVGSRGEIEAVVDVTPNLLSQSHQFRFEIDQTHLPAMISGCRRMLAKFPAR